MVLFQFFLFGGAFGVPSLNLNGLAEGIPPKCESQVNKGARTLRTNNFCRIHRKRLECHVHAKSAEGIIGPLLVVLTRRTEIAWKK